MSDGPETRPVPSLPEAIGPDGRYRVVRLLGAGGMGLVVRARDEILGREVAIKVLADNLAADPDARERFLREARAAAAIHDPRVVAVYDVSEHDGRPYLVMERVDGPALNEVLATGGPLDGDDVADAAVDALAGIARAHEAGLLHRDVKPGNLLRAPDGTVKVTDFGLAVAADAPGLTRAGFVMGTEAYLAPERRRGEPATVATDLWALGATLLELASGHPPSPEADAALDRRGDEIPAPLRELLAQLLAEDPADRPASALDALALLGGDPRRQYGGPETPDSGSDPDVTAALPRDATVALPTTSTSGDAAGETGSDTPTTALATEPDSPAPGAAAPGDDSDEIDLTRWVRVAIAAGLLLVAVVLVNVFAQDGDVDPTFQVEVDPDDPAGTARDLGEQLRERAEG